MPKHRNQSRDSRVLASESPNSILQVLPLTEYCNFRELQAIRQFRG
ncbi:MAG: hypothetical protein AB9861_01145 [Methanosarcina sp.]